jgi:enoyl-CoA hydratase/carnithine racemase
LRALAFGGDAIRAQQAEQLGMVNKVASLEELASALRWTLPRALRGKTRSRCVWPTAQ